MLEKYKKTNISLAVVVLSLSISFIYLLSKTWFKWGDLLIDTFRDSLMVSKILAGQVLYKDFFYEYGLFPPYFLTFLSKLFGLHLNTMAACGIIVTALMAVVLYKISRFFLNEIISGLAVFTFLFVFAFGFYQYFGIFNFILPYSFASIFFVFFVSLSLYFFLCYIISEQDRYLLFWAAAMVLAIFSRIETALLAWSGYVIIIFLYAYKNKNQKRLKLIIYILAPLAISFVGYLLFLFSTQAFDGFRECFIDHILRSRGNFFVVGTMGFANIFSNAMLSFKSLLLHFAILFLLGIGSHAIAAYFQAKEKSDLRLFLGVVITIAAFGFAKFLVNDSLQYRCLPLIFIIGVAAYFIKTIRLPNYKENIAIFAIFLVSLMLSARVFLNPTPGFYGFYLLDLGIICYYIFFFEMFKGRLEKHIKHFSEPLFLSFAACFFAVLVFSWWGISSYLYNGKNLKVSSKRGEYVVWNDNVSKRCWEAIEYIRQYTKEDDKVIVIPEGGSISFFSGRVNPLRHYCILPPSFTIIGEDKIIAEFFNTKADYIVIVQRFTFEYGAPRFGMDYAQGLNTWISKNYSQVKLFGPYPFTSKEFGIAIFKKI